MGCRNIWNDPQVGASGFRRGLRCRRRENRAGIGDTETPQPVGVNQGGPRPALPDWGTGDRVQQCREVGVLGRGVDIRVPHQVPSPGGCDAQGVRGAQVPRVGFLDRGQGADDRSGIGVYVGERGDRTIGAPGAAAATVLTHEAPA